MSLSEYPSTLGNPFTLGVASGDPLPDGVVLWTRLAPDPLHGGGMEGQGDVGVDWEIATDASFTNIIQTSRTHPTAAVKARAVAEEMLAHSVHLEVTELEPATPYYYPLRGRKLRKQGSHQDRTRAHNRGASFGIRLRQLPALVGRLVFSVPAHGSVGSGKQTVISGGQTIASDPGGRVLIGGEGRGNCTRQSQFP